MGAVCARPPACIVACEILTAMARVIWNSMAAAGPILSLEMTAKRSEIQMLHAPVARTAPPGNASTYSTPRARASHGHCSARLFLSISGISKASSDTYIYMPARATCIPVALSNFDPEQDEPVDRARYNIPFHAVYLQARLSKLACNLLSG